MVYNSDLISPAFSKVLSRNLVKIYERVFMKRKAALIIVSGGVGEGKTTFAVHVADFLNQLHGVGPVVLEGNNPPQVSMGGEDFAKKLVPCSEAGFPVLIYDEAGDFNRRGALTRLNALLNRTFETYRAYKVIVILCLPNFAVLDNDLFDKNIPRFLVHLYGRTQNQANGRVYSLYRMFYLKDKMKKAVVKNDAFNKVTPNFFIHCKDLEPERSQALDRLSTRGKKEAQEKATIRHDGLLTYSEIAGKVNKSLIWVKLKAKEYRIKPKKIYKNKFYFDAGAVDVLLNKIDGVEG